MNVRVFVAVPVAETVREQIVHEMRRWRETLPDRSILWVRPEQLHVTLRFFGSIPSAQIEELARRIERAVAGVPPFCLKAEGVGAFPSLHHPRVLWVGVTGEIETLRQLQVKIESNTASFGKPPEAREFDAHLTVARVKDSTARERNLISAFLAKLPTGSLGSWSVDHLELMQSDLSPGGSRYTCLKSISLTAN